MKHNQVVKCMCEKKASWHLDKPESSGSYMAPSYGPLHGGPLIYALHTLYIQGPRLHNSLKKVRDHLKGPSNYPVFRLGSFRVSRVYDLGFRVEGYRAWTFAGFPPKT